MNQAGCFVASIALSSILAIGCGSRVTNIISGAGAGNTDDPRGGAPSSGGSGSRTDGSNAGQPSTVSVAGASGSGSIAQGGSGSSGGTAAFAGQGGNSGSGGMAGMRVITEGEGVPLVPIEGWIDRASNTLMIQGAVFGFGDDTSKLGMTSNFTGDTVCIAGTAAKVDLTCTPVPPATDCYGQYFGAGIGLNLNQPFDTTLDPPMAGVPRPFDASALQGFTFELFGNTVPGPKDFRFKVDDGTTEFCNPASLKIKVGVNTVLFSDLVSNCWVADPTKNKPAVSAQSALIKLAWHVLTNTTATTPFDFCISNIRALTK